MCATSEKWCKEELSFWKVGADRARPSACFVFQLFLRQLSLFLVAEIGDIDDEEDDDGKRINRKP